LLALLGACPKVQISRIKVKEFLNDLRFMVNQKTYDFGRDAAALPSCKTSAYDGTQIGLNLPEGENSITAAR
jgi:hypothetical protein